MLPLSFQFAPLFPLSGFFSLFAMADNHSILPLQGEEHQPPHQASADSGRRAPSLSRENSFPAAWRGSCERQLCPAGLPANCLLVLAQESEDAEEGFTSLVLQTFKADVEEALAVSSMRKAGWRQHQLASAR